MVSRLLHSVHRRQGRGLKLNEKTLQGFKDGLQGKLNKAGGVSPLVTLTKHLRLTRLIYPDERFHGKVV